MFNLFKKHNKNYNPIITATPLADLKGANGVNTLVIAEGCNNDACTESSKKLIGWGSYAGATALERIKQGNTDCHCDNVDQIVFYRPFCISENKFSIHGSVPLRSW